MYYDSGDKFCQWVEVRKEESSMAHVVARRSRARSRRQAQLESVIAALRARYGDHIMGVFASPLEKVH
jgi:hypothetical protein